MKKFLIVCSIFILAFFARFYNFSERITFGPEQARSLIVSANYINDKFSLLGQEYFRSNSNGHKLFASSLFNYSLIPLIYIFKYDPIKITVYFALLNLITGLVLYLLTRKFFNEKIALFGLVLFLFNSYMVYHSMFIWILNYLPLVGILTFYILYKFKSKKLEIKDILALGILSGIGIGMEYLYFLPIIIIVFVLMRLSKNKVRDLTTFAIGGLIGDITQVAFDFKHNFYHTKVLWQYALDTLTGSSDAGFTYYHFLYLWPIFAVFGGILLFKLYKKNKLLSIFLVIVYIFMNLKSQLINFHKPVGMLDGLNIQKLINVSETISQDSSNNFNLVTLYDFDTRGYTLRYLVKYRYHREPQNEINYKDVDSIYALAKDNYDFNSNNPWELNVFKPYNIERIESVGNGFELFKLTK